MAIDWQFIEGLEGARVLKGYVPNPTGSDSGVTIASGVDLGQRKAADIAALGLPASLANRLGPYLGKRKAEAVAALAAAPLSITAAEAGLLDKAVHTRTVEALRQSYDADGVVPFDDLPGAAQTVIASVAFQYGTNLRKRTPNFWTAACGQDWPGVIAELRDFGDSYPTRRKREAAYLETRLGQA